MSAEIVGLVSNLAKSTPPFIPVMRNSLNERLPKRQKEIPVETDKTNGEFDRTLFAAYRALPGEAFGKVVLDSLESYYHSSYTHQRDLFLQRLQQARATSITALVLLITGTFIMLAGVALLFFGNHVSGTVVVISGIISEVLGFLILQFNKQLNDLLDVTAKQLDTLARTQDAMNYIDRIADTKTKGEAIEDLLKSILDMKDVTSV